MAQWRLHPNGKEVRKRHINKTIAAYDECRDGHTEGESDHRDACGGYRDDCQGTFQRK